MKSNTSSRQDVLEQLAALKELVAGLGPKAGPVDLARATIAAECSLQRVKEFCEYRFGQGGGDGLDRAAA